MSNRPKFLLNIMILLVLTVVPWYYLVESQFLEIERKVAEINKVEEDMIDISSIAMSSDSILRMIVKKYNAEVEGNKVIVIGVNNSSGTIRSMEDNMFMVERVEWNGGVSSIYFKR